MSAGFADIPGYRADDAAPCPCKQCGPGPGITAQEYDRRRARWASNLAHTRRSVGRELRALAARDPEISKALGI